MFRLDQKSVVITGGGSGIGSAIAQLFAGQGAIVHIVDIDAAAAERNLGYLRDSGNEVHFHQCDVSNQAQVVGCMNAIKKVDILVNNAGIAHVGKADTTSEADFDRVMNINVKGMYNCLFAVLPLMKANNGGIILNTASIASSVGIKDRFAYSTSKGAIHAMTMSVARDYICDHIRCNSISPARIHTPFVDGFISKNYPGREQEMFGELSRSQPIGRMGTVNEVAALALFLCSDEAAFITGCDYPIDGGFIKLNN